MRPYEKDIGECKTLCPGGLIISEKLGAIVSPGDEINGLDRESFTPKPGIFFRREALDEHCDFCQKKDVCTNEIKAVIYAIFVSFEQQII